MRKEMKAMSKIMAVMIGATMLFTMTACGGNDSKESGKGDNTSSQMNESKQSEEPAEIKPAEDGVLTISKGNIAIVVNGTTVFMPYNLTELEEAGVPVNDSFKEEDLEPGDSYSLNLYLDDECDYMIVPSYYNEGDETVALTKAEAKTIGMNSFADEITDQGVSILGVTFGMTKSEVIEMLGEPLNNYGTYCEWQVEVSDADYVGSLIMYFVEDSDDAGISEVRLDFMEW